MAHLPQGVELKITFIFTSFPDDGRDDFEDYNPYDNVNY